jgi:tRNA(adenine34) deaminase
VDDVAAMRLALEEAGAAFHEDEVPVGAVLVAGDRVLARGHNRVEHGGDPTAHAEVVALRAAAEAHGRDALRDATLYVTMEPCPMCAGALVLARVARVVFGCDDPKAGAVRSLYTVLSDSRLNHRCRVTGGVLAGEGSALLEAFFESRRARNR